MTECARALLAPAFSLFVFSCFLFSFLSFPCAAVAEEGGRISPWEFHQGLSPWLALVFVIAAVCVATVPVLSGREQKRTAEDFPFYSYASCDD